MVEGEELLKKSTAIQRAQKSTAIQRAEKSMLSILASMKEKRRVRAEDVLFHFLSSDMLSAVVRKLLLASAGGRGSGVA